MSDDSVTVVNNENPTINLEIASYKNDVDLDFVHSIDSTILVHNSNEEAHKNILDVIREQKADKVDVQSKLDLKANMSVTYTKSENNTLLFDKLDKSDSTVTKQGNSFNGANQLVLLNSSGQLPAIDGGLLTNLGGLKLNELGTINSSIILPANTVTTASVNNSVVLSLSTNLIEGAENTIIFDFTTSNSSQPTISTSAILKWSDKNGGKAPSVYSTLTGVRNRLIFKTSDGGFTWEAEYSNYGGVEMAFVQPILYADGVSGGSAFSVYATNVYNGNFAYRGTDNNSSTYFQAAPGNGTVHIWYNPTPLKLTSIWFENAASNDQALLSYALYGSNDNSTYTLLKTGTNSITWANAFWELAIPSEKVGFYNYYKIYASGANAYLAWKQATLSGKVIAV